MRYRRRRCAQPLSRVKFILTGAKSGLVVKSEPLSKEVRSGAGVAPSSGEPCLFSHIRKCKMGIVFSDPLWLARGAGAQKEDFLIFPYRAKG